MDAETLKARSGKSTKEALRTCSQCAAIWLTSEQGNACPTCGWAPVPMSKPIAVREADLQEMADAEDQLAPQDQRVIWFYREACGWYARRWADRWRDTPNKGRAWAWMQTQAKFQIGAQVRIPSSYWTLPLVLPSAEVSGWLHHRIIKFARARAKAAA